MTFISRIQLRHTAKDLGSSPTSKRNADLLTRHNRLVRQITSLCEIQATYIPGTHTVLQALQKAKSKDGKPSLFSYAETIPLIFPSNLPVTTRRAGVVAGLADAELRFRDAQCRNNLKALRNQLIIKSRLMTYKNLQTRHQGATTSLLDSNERKVQLHAARYRVAHQAKIRLVGDGMVGWRKLEDQDIRCMEDEEALRKRMKRTQ